MRKEDRDLREAIQTAGLVDLPESELEAVTGGKCGGGCFSQCFSCSTCSTGSSSGGGGVFEENP